MDTKLYLAIVAVLSVVYGIMFVIFPSEAVAFYGATEPNAAAAYNIQFFGSAILALGVIAWSARSFTDWHAVRSVLIGGLVADIVGLLLAIWGIKQGLVNQMGWSSVVVYVLLTAGALYCLRGRVTQAA
jgi:hypothetical protein